MATNVTETAVNHEIETSDASITLYPNPAINDFIVRLESSGSMESISVYNATGVLINTFYPGYEVKEAKINCSSYPPGFYFIKIETEKGSSIGKLIKK
jgi:hypothetical protein